MYLFNVLLKTDINRIQFWCNWSRSYDQAVITSSVCELQRGLLRFPNKKMIQSWGAGHVSRSDASCNLDGDIVLNNF